MTAKEINLAADLGGTRIKIGVVCGGEVLAHTVVPAQSQSGIKPQLPLIKNEWLKLLNQLQLTFRDCSGISLAFPSLVDPASGRILDSYGKFADAPQIDLRLWAQWEMDLPLAIENDARMALVGEWKYGAGRGYQDIVMITLGTGIGTSAIIEGRLLRGSHHQAGILGGHSTVNYGGAQCSCGNVGCAEAEASKVFLAELAKTRPDFSSSPLATETELDFAAIYKQARLGDSCALALRDHSIQVWSSVAVNLIHAYDPSVVIIGGGVMSSADVILPLVQQYVDLHAHTPFRKAMVLASLLGDRAALLASEWLLHEQFPNRRM